MARCSSTPDCFWGTGGELYRMNVIYFGEISVVIFGVQPKNELKSQFLMNDKDKHILERSTITPKNFWLNLIKKVTQLI